MAAVVWVYEPVVLALHEEHLAEHGGAVGVRDRGLLESALHRPRNLALYDQPDIAALAAAYGFGLIRNHTFLDGNKRTGFTVTELFLALNGWRLTADDTTSFVTILKLAEGTLSETDFAMWIRGSIRSVEQNI